MIALGRYAETNVVTRAMLSGLLTKHDFDAMIHASSIPEAWSLLRKSEYGAALPSTPSHEALDLEKHLRQASALRFQRSIRRLHGRATTVAALLLSRWDLDNLEFVLRLWHGKDACMLLMASLPHFVDDLPYTAIGEAKTVDEVVAALHDTPYAGPIADASSTYQEKQSVFYIESALEMDYYRRLLAAVKALGGADAREGLAVIGAEIDMLNLAWIARRMQYQQVSLEDAASSLIPGPAELSRELTAPGLTEDRLAALSEKHIGRMLPGGEGAGSNLQRLSLLEHVLGEMAASSALRQFMQYPFNIGCVYSFYILIRLELKKLCAVFTGKAAGFSERDIEARWRGGR